MATAASLITTQTIEGRTYYTAVRRGVSYCAHELAGRWFVSTQRLALGPRHIGGGRYYDTLTELASGCKAFAGLDVLVSL